MKLLKLLLTTILFAFFQSTTVQAQTNNSLNIDTSPNGFLFNLTNMKPGDWATRKLTIQNRGSEDFQYNTQARFKGGSKDLYNEFLLKVWDSTGVLHSGKLKDFNGLSPRYLKSKHEEDLMFEVKLPYELGNQFQGLALEVEFKFIIEGYNPEDPEDPEDSEDPEDPTDPGNPENPNDDGTILPERPIDEEDLNSPPVQGQILPETATNMYNYLIGGLLMVIFGTAALYYQRKSKPNDKYQA
jgi:LPXTG-motif cell wall-anchored protein